MTKIQNVSTITTTDLSKFDPLRREQLLELLIAWRDQGLPEDFECREVIPMVNINSGNVFLTNEDYQVAMMNGNKLESFYSCPICGHEGFMENMEHDSDDEECQEYLAQIRGQ